MSDAFQHDIDTIAGIPAVPSILDVVCHATGMRFATVARVTEARWVACGVRDTIAFSLAPGGELAIETTFCDSVRQANAAIFIDNVAEDPIYASHPTPARYGFQSYVSVPIRLPGGEIFGTLCALDPEPARVSTPQIMGMFTLFAELIGFHIDAVRRLALSEASVTDLRATGALREEFIAVLGHDLRNPLAAIRSGANLLGRGPLDPSGGRVLELMHGSIARMSRLIDDVLDFARGRLGAGLPIERGGATPLGPVLEHVVAELRASSPERVILTDFTTLAHPVDCDPARVAQLLSNLLGNALSYGAPETPVHVTASASDGVFVLSVGNQGAPIPPEALSRLFQPFTRGALVPDQPAQRQGLGLGLYIASEIARAHHGTLDVASTGSETRFTLRMPLAAPR